MHREFACFSVNFFLGASTNNVLNGTKGKANKLKFDYSTTAIHFWSFVYKVLEYSYDFRPSESITMGLLIVLWENKLFCSCLFQWTFEGCCVAANVGGRGI